MEISFEDNKIDETMSSPCIYEHVKNAVQEAHGDYGRACLARSLRGTLSIIICYPSLREQSQLRSIKLSVLSFLKNVPFSTSPLPHSGVFFKRSFYSSFSALIVFIVFNFS